MGGSKSRKRKGGGGITSHTLMSYFSAKGAVKTEKKFDLDLRWKPLVIPLVIGKILNS